MSADSGPRAGGWEEEDIFGLAEDELPSQLSIGDDLPGEDGVDGDSTPLPEELPLSQGSVAAPVASESSAEASVDAHAARQAQPPTAGGPQGNVESAGPVVQVSIFARRGRPDRALQDALRRAMPHATPQGADGPLPALEQGRALRLAAQRQDAERNVAQRQERQKLLREAKLDDIEMTSLLKRPVGGILPLTPAGASSPTKSSTRTS